jgi:hypothetical protein
MRTEQHIKNELKKAESSLKRTRENFQKYDNIEDMHEIERLKAYIDALRFALY